MGKKQDMASLETFKPLVEAIARNFGSHCEVVLHSLHDLRHSLIYIVNEHVTGRRVGSPMTDLGIEVLTNADKLENDTMGPYTSQLDDGRLLRCVSTLIRNPAGKPIGMLCINLDLSVPLLDLLRDFKPVAEKETETAIEHFALTPEELILRALSMARRDVNKINKLSPSDRNKQIVFELNRRGVFSVRGAIDTVAKESGISRYTVYNYLREARIEDRES